VPVVGTPGADTGVGPWNVGAGTLPPGGSIVGAPGAANVAPGGGPPATQPGQPPSMPQQGAPHGAPPGGLQLLLNCSGQQPSAVTDPNTVGLKALYGLMHSVAVPQQWWQWNHQAEACPVLRPTPARLRSAANNNRFMA
jgi:hypothetical protein